MRRFQRCCCRAQADRVGTRRSEGDTHVGACRARNAGAGCLQIHQKSAVALAVALEFIATVYSSAPLMPTVSVARYCWRHWHPMHRSPQPVRCVNHLVVTVNRWCAGFAVAAVMVCPALAPIWNCAVPKVPSNNFWPLNSVVWEMRSRLRNQLRDFLVQRLAVTCAVGRIGRLQPIRGHVAKWRWLHHCAFGLPAPG